MIAMAIMVFSMSLLWVGTRMMGHLQRQWVWTQVQREAEVNLYGILNDVRNAESVVFVSSTTLILRHYNNQRGYDVAVPWANSFYNEVNIGTVTYQYIPGEQGVLRRTVVFNDIPKQKDFLKGYLTPPDNAHPIFEGYPSPLAPRGAQVWLRFGTGFFKSAPRVYESRAMVRSLKE